jgi:hypothetical protein
MDEASVAMLSSAGLEMVWSAIAVVSAFLGVLGEHPLTMSAIAAVSIALALFAQSGELAAGLPRRVEIPGQAVALNVVAAVATLALGALALVGVVPIVLAPIALLVLAAFLVLDAPLTSAVVSRHSTFAGGVMVFAGLGAILVLVSGFSARAGEPTLIPWAALMVAVAHLVGAVSVLRRFAQPTAS